ncbi:family 16 glycosylhydrolase [Coraliomargarita sp. SDUM461003]|uniref:Family 16 glycosylhydrolase n=1 Tax=Thalassobacterium maritimum TaxID=3041265 RepID=A0ABU1AYT9_9BACT|nr:family 16 glycosylhydrolase [Coraliomargarita sp. SDUM461003]MDQ8209324.1 family 16 glycosylhydrolase [Coraliomargarita sp. SDUM461003]
MKYPTINQFKGMLLACLMGWICSPLAAKDLTLEVAKEMRGDIDVVSEALDHLLASSDASLVEEGQSADTALERVAEHLDHYITETEALQASVGAYDGGKQYPAASTVSIEDFDVPVGATQVHVPVNLDKPSVNSVVAHIRVYNGKGGRANPDKTQAIIFRPGDPLTKYVSFDVSGMKEGHNVKALQSSVPDGAKRGKSGILITARPGAINKASADTSRDAQTFQPLGELSYSVTGQTVQFDDKGGSNMLTTALAHGRTQPGNGETGYYGTVEFGGFKRTEEGLAISTRRLETPVSVGTPATAYPFLASMLSGYRTPETQFKYGSVEWVVKMPNRRGSWPALWLLPIDGWPPEIDVYEGFGYNGSWKFNSDLSTNLHGGDKGVRTFTRAAMRMKMSDFGLANTLDSEFHTFSVTVTPEWITMFVDGVETMCYANPFAGEVWYPLTNVAVKAGIDSPYEDGSGDMILRSLKVWRAE